MKREGRQHGMVRTYRIIPTTLDKPRPEHRFVNRFDSPSTAGFFTKVSSKPTNHSKFTGKCGQSRWAESHVNPACKSKEKAGKGTQKQRTRNVDSNYKSGSCRVVDGRSGLSFAGASATGILDHLASEYMDDEDYDYDVDDDDCVGEVYEGLCGLVDDGSIGKSHQLYENDFVESSGVDEIKVDDDDDKDYSSNNIDHEDGKRFTEVGFVLDQVDEDDDDDDDDWYLVEEM